MFKGSLSGGIVMRSKRHTVDLALSIGLITDIDIGSVHPYFHYKRVYFFSLSLLVVISLTIYPGGSSIPAALRPVSLLKQQTSPRGSRLPALLGLCVADSSPVSMFLWIQRELPGAALWAFLCFSVRYFLVQQRSREVHLSFMSFCFACIHKT